MEEIKVLDVYTDSKGIEHKIDEMEIKMIYFTVLKYGTADLISKGYQKVVDRFNAKMKEIDIFKLISEKKEEKEVF